MRIFSFPSFFLSLLGCGDTLFLDMTFLFLILITLLLNRGQLHRLMVEKRPYFISLEVVHLFDFNQGIQQQQQHTHTHTHGLHRWLGAECLQWGGGHF